MIRSWASASTRRFAAGKASRFRGLDVDAAHELLAVLDAATALADLSPLKSVGLHKLKGNRMNRTGFPRRPHCLGGWGLWDVQVGFLRKCANVPSGMVEEHREAHASEWAVLQSVAPKLGCTAETRRTWVRQAQRDAGHRPGPDDERAGAVEGAGARGP